MGDMTTNWSSSHLFNFYRGLFGQAAAVWPGASFLTCHLGDSPRNFHQKVGANTPG